ncbi:MAG: DoxX family protein [Cyclobacteriaceae bacterium]
MKKSKVLNWGARIVAAVILLQTLFFKFSGAEESVYIFTMVGMEPWGRIGVGIMELIASVLLLITPIAWMGGLIAVGLMLGAIGMHLTLLGIEVQGDGGYLFILAVVVTVCGAIVLWHDQEKAIAFVKKLID